MAAAQAQVTAGRADPSRTLRRALLGALAALALLHAAVLAYHVSLTLAFPYDLDYGEGYVLNDALRLARGEPLYVDLQRFPMVRSPYPPLFPALWSALTPLAGPHLWPGRLLAALALAGVVGVVAWSGRRVGLGGWPVLAAVGVVVGSPYVYQWAGYARVDTLAVLGSAGAVAAAHWLPGRRGLLLAAALCGLALWTKQTAVAAPTAIALALLVRRPRDAATFVGVLALPSLALFAALESSSGGQFSRHVLLGNAQNPLHAGRMMVALTQFLAIHLPLVAAAGWWLARAGLRGVPSPIALYALLALGSTPSVGNQGSSVNYFLEPIAACALALPLAWRAWQAHASEAAHLLAPGLASLQLLLLLHWPNGFGLDQMPVAPHGRTPTSADRAAAEVVDAAVRAEPREVIAEPAGFALRHGRPVHIQPIDLRAERFHGRWDPAPLLAALRSGEFGLVVEAYRLLPFEMEDLLRAEFTLEREVRGDNGLVYRLWRPRG